MLKADEVIQQSHIRFGTSGARGLVEDFSPSVCQAFTHAFLNHMQVSFRVKQVLLGIDNRPSSLGIACQCGAAIKALGLQVHFAGVLPTPALAYFAMQQKIPAIMVTGSHIPFDRNGLKFYRPNGEITKQDEARILGTKVHFTLADPVKLVSKNQAADAYIQRYCDFFAKDLLMGKRIGVYQHSSAGRNLYPALFTQLGATVIELAPSNHFVAIDTEAIREEDEIKARIWAKRYRLDALFSTDGDGDRPLVADEQGRFVRGDILGMLCAKGLGIDAIALPISCNSMIASLGDFRKVQQTQIGSPYVIAALEALSGEFAHVAGFEANGGFMLGSDIAPSVDDDFAITSSTLTRIYDYQHQHALALHLLTALPTRDAVLPFLMLMQLAKTTSIATLIDSLPARFTHSDRLQNIATTLSQALLHNSQQAPEQLLDNLGINSQLSQIDNTDGLRLILSDKRIIHLRQSGNAPELRCYTEAASLNEAKQLNRQVLTKLSPLLERLNE